MTSCSWLAVSSVPPCDTLPRIPLCLSQPQMMIQFTFTTAFNNQFNSLIFNFSHTLCWYYYLEWTVTSSTDQSVKQSAWNHIRGSGSVLTCPICCSVAVAGCWSSSSLYAERTEHLHICSTPSTHHLTENTPHTHSLTTSKLSRSHKWRRAVIGWQPKTLNHQQVKYWWARSTRWLRWVRCWSCLLKTQQRCFVFTASSYWLSVVNTCLWIWCNMFQTCNWLILQ